MNTQAIPTTLVVASGKGGVGKTQLSADLARALSAEGHTVGFLDADISTPNAPEAFVDEGESFADQPLSDGEHLLPVVAGGVHVFSEGLSLEDDVAILRDDQWKAESVLNYIHTVDWPEGTDYLVVDSPPGNGSEIQLVISEVNPDHGFLVTTGAVHSARDTRRTHELFVQAGIDHSVIANMRYAMFDIDLGTIEARVQGIQGIGPAKAADIREIVNEVAGETAVPLLDDDLDLAARIGAPVVADVPFTANEALRREALVGALDVLPRPAVVE